MIKWFPFLVKSNSVIINFFFTFTDRYGVKNQLQASNQKLLDPSANGGSVSINNKPTASSDDIFDNGSEFSDDDEERFHGFTLDDINATKVQPSIVLHKRIPKQKMASTANKSQVSYHVNCNSVWNQMLFLEFNIKVKNIGSIKVLNEIEWKHHTLIFKKINKCKKPATVP